MTSLVEQFGDECLLAWRKASIERVQEVSVGLMGASKSEKRTKKTNLMRRSRRARDSSISSSAGVPSPYGSCSRRFRLPVHLEIERVAIRRDFSTQLGCEVGSGRDLREEGGMSQDEKKEEESVSSTFRSQRSHD